MRIEDCHVQYLSLKETASIIGGDASVPPPPTPPSPTTILNTLSQSGNLGLGIGVIIGPALAAQPGTPLNNAVQNASQVIQNKLNSLSGNQVP
jgi:hypothetical protein